MGEKPKIIVYVDGFNLFRRALAGTRYMWLDVLALAQRALPGREVVAVKYFTAEIKPHPGNLHALQRQKVYLSALEAVPLVEIHLGYFRRDVSPMPRHPWELDADGLPVTVKVKQVREKGSDVNLASHLLWDALHGSADSYAVLTNDSDLVSPIKMLRDRKGTDVGVLFPSSQVSKDLEECCAWSRRIHPGMLKKSLLPNPAPGVHGEPIAKPEEWA